MKPLSLMLMSVVALAGCTTQGGPHIISKLGTDPTLAGGTYTTGGGVTVAADIREKNGQTLLCGAWAQSRSQSILTKGRSKDVVARGSVEIDGTVVARNLSFMKEVPPAADYGGQDAGCILTSRAWQAGDEARDILARIPGHLVVREVGDVSGGVFVYFRPTGPGAGDV